MTSLSPQMAQSSEPRLHRRRLNRRPTRLATAPLRRMAAGATRKPMGEMTRTAAPSRQHSSYKRPRRPRRFHSTRPSFPLFRQAPCKHPALPKAMTAPTSRVPLPPPSRRSPKIMAARQRRLHPQAKAPPAISRLVRACGSADIVSARAGGRDGPEPAAQIRAPIQVSAADNDDGADVVNGDPSNGAVGNNSDGPAAQNKIGAGKLAANTPNSIGLPASRRWIPTLPLKSYRRVDGDAGSAAQNVISAPLPRNPNRWARRDYRRRCPNLGAHGEWRAGPGLKARRRGHDTNGQARSDRFQYRHRRAAGRCAGKIPPPPRVWAAKANFRAARPCKRHRATMPTASRHASFRPMRCAATGHAFARCPCRNTRERPAARLDGRSTPPAQILRTTPPMRW